MVCRGLGYRGIRFARGPGRTLTSCLLLGCQRLKEPNVWRMHDPFPEVLSTEKLSNNQANISNCKQKSSRQSSRVFTTTRRSNRTLGFEMLGPHRLQDPLVNNRCRTSHSLRLR